MAANIAASQNADGSWRAFPRPTTAGRGRRRYFSHGAVRALVEGLRSAETRLRNAGAGRQGTPGAALSEQVAGAQAPAPPPNPNVPVAPWEPSASAPAIPSWRTELKQLAPNVWTYIQAGGPNIPTGGISNALAVAGPDHWLAVDALG